MESTFGAFVHTRNACERLRLSEITKGPGFAMERVAVVRFDRLSSALVL